MSANHASPQKSRSAADRLERKLAKIKAAERKKFLNEDIVRLEKNGDLSYEAVRTYAVPVGQASGLPEIRQGETPAEPGPCADSLTAPTENAANPNLLPNRLPETPVTQQIGNLIDGVAVGREANHGSVAVAQMQAATDVTPSDAITSAGQDTPPDALLSCHEPASAGNQSPGNQDAADPLTDLLHRALVATKTRRGRPPVLDDQAKGQLIALLSVGMSLRQAAAVLGVSHTTVQKTLKADPALAEEITAARFQAQLQPLACIIREARRSWKAATWLLKYLDAKIASHEETPDERRQRQQHEADELFARAGGRNVKTRRVVD